MVRPLLTVVHPLLIVARPLLTVVHPLLTVVRPSSQWFTPSPQAASEEKSARTWLYQTCSELGWFQVAPAENPMRSANLTLGYFRAHCAEVFERRPTVVEGAVLAAP